MFVMLTAYDTDDSCHLVICITLQTPSGMIESLLSFNVLAAICITLLMILSSRCNCLAGNFCRFRVYDSLHFTGLGRQNLTDNFQHNLVGIICQEIVLCITLLVSVISLSVPVFAL